MKGKFSRYTQFHSIIIAMAVFYTVCVHAAGHDRLNQDAIDTFITDMAGQHGFNASQLQQTFSKAVYLQSIIDAISRPAEKMPWYRYKPIFLTDERAKAGAAYWHEHADTLAAAERKYGVPAEIIVAIIGVETRFGEYTGDYRVLDSLATLAFHYPERADFFRSELEQFFLLTREQGVDPLSIEGSYAGAMGIPQFISSSYRHYAIDFNDDQRINLWSDHVDAIGSVANYFSRHGWQPGQPVIYPVTAMPVDYSELERKELKPNTNYGLLHQSGVQVAAALPADTPVALLEFEQRAGPAFWLGLENFYVITRYNHSQLYALAVYLLAQDIHKRYRSDIKVSAP